MKKIIISLGILCQILTQNIDAKSWIEYFGKWLIERDNLIPKSKPNDTFPEFCLLNTTLNSQSVWQSTSIDFRCSDMRNSTQFGLILNVNSLDNFQLMRISNYNNSAIIQLIRWQYGHFRIWYEQKISQTLSDSTLYRLSILRAPLVDTEDWRQWKIIITNLQNNCIILKQGIENEQPAFGIGRVGIYSNSTLTKFENFRIDTINNHSGKLQLAPLFSNGMVLQRNKPINIWGKAEPNTSICIILLSHKYKTVSDNSGNWKMILPELPVQTDLELKVKAGNDSLIINDIAVGEVWLASGQSNMEMRVWQTDVAKLKMNFNKKAQIRFFLQPQIPSQSPRFNTGGYWAKSDSSRSVMGWSAVALSFATELNKKLNVPIGILSSNWGGTAIESWFPQNELSVDSLTSPIIKRYKSFQVDLEKGIIPEYQFPYSWDIPGQRHAPGYLFNGMILPHIPYTIQGVIWYQGESNSTRSKQYEHLFKMLITSWRKAWNNDKMNFYYVQLAGYDGKQSGSEISNAWPQLRESQRLTLAKFKNIGMVVTTDLGDSSDIHPFRKIEVGVRLSRLALYDTYGRHEIIRCSPLYQSVTFNSNIATVKFSETGDGLKFLNGSKLNGFSIAGEDKKFLPAEAEILLDGKSVKVYNNLIQKPVAVRYAWENNPVNANLGNSANLPASPFKTDKVM